MAGSAALIAGILAFLSGEWRYGFLAVVLGICLFVIDISSRQASDSWFVPPTGLGILTAATVIGIAAFKADRWVIAIPAAVVVLAALATASGNWIAKAALVIGAGVVTLLFLASVGTILSLIVIPLLILLLIVVNERLWFLVGVLAALLALDIYLLNRIEKQEQEAIIKRYGETVFDLCTAPEDRPTGFSPFPGGKALFVKSGEGNRGEVLDQYSSRLPGSFRADNQDEVAAVVCIFKTKQVYDSSLYSNGATCVRHQQVVIAYFVDATTGNLMLTQEFYGSVPPGCPSAVSSIEGITKTGGEPSVQVVADWVVFNFQVWGNSQAVGGDGAADLTQEFVSTTTGFTVKYPDGWAAQDGEVGVEIANKAEYLEAGSEDTIPEDAALVMFMPPFAAADLGLPEDATVKDFLGILAQGEGAQAGEAKDVKIGDKDAVRVDMKEADSKSSEGFFVGFKVDDTHFVIAIVATSEGKLDDYESTALKIIESMTYTAPSGDDDDNGGGSGGDAADLTQEFKSALGFTVNYPEGWAAQDGEVSVEIANKAEYLEARSEEMFPEDAVLVMFIPPLPAADMGLTDEASVGDFLVVMAQGEGGAEVGEAKNVKIGDKDAVRVDMQDANTKSEGFFVGYKADDTHVVIAIVATSEGKLGDYESTALKIIESATYTAPEGAG